MIRFVGDVMLSSIVSERLRNLTCRRNQSPPEAARTQSVGNELRLDQSLQHVAPGNHADELAFIYR